MPENKNDKDSIYVALGIYGAIGFQLAISVVGGLLLGNWIDSWLETEPWFLLLGLLLGAGAGFYNLIRLLKWNEKRRDK
ncbi:MAG: hypothetical protein COX62_05850 [Deltaproteobacteria bacterium CG_4_10_14_0_2_um_filter_43_8]|nr:MAG: hypothetical protein COV43_08305 [Deltaproteobacteria bacterium CG11_big_fil_rev_8_21_14_0_20_42_23]PJA19882.1 MAG: hypothetical protein COX62_05850 [Deltaproteobacteria bacterium CG_4_10_14_0_2_um_filter_43_8]PJC63399.1 MAG: hypothetical protein CO021_09520 [Deltaproteobacteria bacterium CG_4_9_14_0_2_um_filter_42_21]